jgi:uncharacterized membrane protein YfcA
MLIPSTLANGWMVWANRQAVAEARYMWPMYVLGVAGTAAGTWILVSFDDRWLSLALAATIVFYAAVFFAKPDLQFSRRFTDKANAPLGLAAGVLQGSTGLSGPIVATYFHGFRMSRTTYLFTVTALYGLFGATQIVALVGFGSFTLERFWQGMATLIPLALALPPGLRLSARISHVTFERSVLALLLVVAARLVWSSITG